jgi:hypothetical protein
MRLDDGTFVDNVEPCDACKAKDWENCAGRGYRPILDRPDLCARFRRNKVSDAKTCEVEGCPLPPSRLSGICDAHERHTRSCHYPEGGTCSCAKGDV